MQDNDATATISLLCWNIGNPSIERAKKQVEWLKNRGEFFLILTEAKGSKGCHYMNDYFKSIGYNTIFPDMDSKEYGTIIVSKHALEKSEFTNNIDFLSARVVAANVVLPLGKTEIIGLYIPSRNANEDKIKRKKIFIEKVSNAIQNSSLFDFRIVCGDFNILEPNHYPHYSFFKDWEYGFYDGLLKVNMIDAFRYLNPDTREYSWIGKTGNGYRYDHFFVSNNMSKFVEKCFYDHSPQKKNLSDHSSMVLEIKSNI